MNAVAEKTKQVKSALGAARRELAGVQVRAGEVGLQVKKLRLELLKLKEGDDEQ